MQMSCSRNPSWEQELPDPEVICFSGKEAKKETNPETKPENICSTLKSSYSLQFVFSFQTCWTHCQEISPRGGITTCLSFWLGYWGCCSSL